MDMIGLALSGYDTEARRLYLATDKTVFPAHKDLQKTFNNKGSFNSNFSLYLLEKLADFCPVEFNDIFEFAEFLKDNTNSYHNFVHQYDFIVSDVSHEYAFDKYFKQYLSSESPKDEGIVISIAIIAGLYTAYIDQDVLFLLTLFDSMCDVYSVPKQLQMLAYIIYRLCYTGYFGYHMMEEVIDSSLVDESFDEFFSLLVEHNIDREFLSKPFDDKLVKTNTYSEQLLAETLFYMCRVDAAYRTENFKSLPREQLFEIYTSRKYPADLAFLFGVLCTVSEQMHPLIPKNLRECNPYTEVVESVLSYL